jgi:SPP1 family predicted phage head-tail adaptor
VIKPIDPGEFRTPVVLQNATYTKNSVGQPVETWSDVATIWAKVSPLSAREQFYAAQTQASRTHNVIMRYDSRVTPTCRLKIAGTDRILAIEGVRDLEERRQYMVVGATEQVPSES